MPFQIVRNDITKMEVDAIVNAANTSLLGGGGVDGAIHEAAGPRLLEECRKLGGCPVGEARITYGYNLPAKYVIHTVGPVWTGGRNNEERLLASAYRSSLRLAKEHEVGSIAFPLISSGAYGFPKERALKIAVDTITSTLREDGYDDMEAYLVIFDSAASVLSEELYGEIEEFIDDTYADRHYPNNARRGRWGFPASRDTIRKRREVFEEVRPELELGEEDFVDVSEYIGTVKDMADAVREAESGESDELSEPVRKLKRQLDSMLRRQEESLKGLDDLDSSVFGLGKRLSDELLAGSVEANEEDLLEIPDDDFATRYLESLKTPKLKEFPDIEKSLSAKSLGTLPGLPRPASAKSLAEYLETVKDESFQQMLFRKIDRSGMTDPEVYKRANISRKLFSKIRNESYHPSKNTVIALAVALKLDIYETEELLMKAGYALSNREKFDLIVRYFIEVRKIYNVHTINEALFAFDQPLLGAS